jgi:hypothetical protein
VRRGEIHCFGLRETIACFIIIIIFESEYPSSPLINTRTIRIISIVNREKSIQSREKVRFISHFLSSGRVGTFLIGVLAAGPTVMPLWNVGDFDAECRLQKFPGGETCR